MERIILDTDLAMGAPGSEIDDGFALALARAEPDIAIDAVTTVNGNTDVETATFLTAELLGRLRVDDIPLFKGAASPLTRPGRVRAPAASVVEAFGDHRPTPGYAAAEIARIVMASPGEITLVAIGPLTNVAAALSLEPHLAESVKEIVIMGGVFLTGTGQASMPGEFNVWVDPEAAEAVLRSGAAIRWVGLDVTLQVRLTRDHAAQMSRATGDFARFAGDATTAWIDTMAAKYPGDPGQKNSCAMHDPLAVAVVARPELVTWTPAFVTVVTGDGPARGVMVTDLLTSTDAPAANCRIATAVDVDAFTDYFLRSVTSL